MNFRGRNIDLVGKQNLWFGISLAVILIGMASWIMFGLNLGIDFKGGGQLQYRIPYDKRPAAGQEAAYITQVRGQLDQKGLRGARLQIAGGNALVVATDARGDDELRSQDRMVREALAQQLSGKDSQGRPQLATDPGILLGRQLVGPVIGEELRRNAINGVLLGVLLIALWIYIRYNFAGDGLRYAVAGILALVHDVLVLVGLFALIGKIDPRVEVDGSFIAALLTVVGYSINDSVVIFDRIRENLRARRKEPFNTIVNDSLLETMSRSINTGLTVLIMLFALLLLGGESIYNFVLAMLVGITSGLYSSIFNASMVLTAWHSWDEKKAAAARAARGAVRGPGRTVTVRDTAPGQRASQPAFAGVNRPGLATSPRVTNGASVAARDTAPRPTEGAVTSVLPSDATAAGTASAASDSGSVINSPISTESGESATSTPARAAASRKARAKRRF
ncbi:MAG: protein translocase subunit SecF [Abitibacteriaceae bacterium]|nr:protein translocase subunit SecF [Abditibacteriaceae bacterium]